MRIRCQATLDWAFAYLFLAVLAVVRWLAFLGALPRTRMQGGLVCGFDTAAFCSANVSVEIFAHLPLPLQIFSNNLNLLPVDGLPLQTARCYAYSLLVP